MDVFWQLHGADEIQKRLKSLGDEKRVRKVARAAARKAMNIVRDDVRRRAKALDDPESAAVIAKNVATQESARAGRRMGAVVMRVGIRGGANTRSDGQGVTSLSGGDTRHWRYIEFGTESIAAQPFMRPALASNAERVASAVMAELDRQLTKAGA